LKKHQTHTSPPKTSTLLAAMTGTIDIIINIDILFIKNQCHGIVTVSGFSIVGKSPILSIHKRVTKNPLKKGGLSSVAGTGFEPVTSGL